MISLFVEGERAILGSLVVPESIGVLRDLADKKDSTILRICLRFWSYISLVLESNCRVDFWNGTCSYLEQQAGQHYESEAETGAAV